MVPDAAQRETSPGPWEWRVMEGCLLSNTPRFLLARAAAAEDSRLFRVSLSASPSDRPLAAGEGVFSCVYVNALCF